MTLKEKTFRVIEFKTQEEIFADRQKKIDDQRKALDKKLEFIKKGIKTI